MSASKYQFKIGTRLYESKATTLSTAIFHTCFLAAQAGGIAHLLIDGEKAVTVRNSKAFQSEWWADELMDIYRDIVMERTRKDTE